MSATTPSAASAQRPGSPISDVHSACSGRDALKVRFQARCFGPFTTDCVEKVPEGSRTGSVHPEKYNLAECHLDHAPDGACLLLKFGPDDWRADFFNTIDPERTLASLPSHYRQPPHKVRKGYRLEMRFRRRL